MPLVALCPLAYICAYYAKIEQFESCDHNISDLEAIQGIFFFFSKKFHSLKCLTLCCPQDSENRVSVKIWGFSLLPVEGALHQPEECAVVLLQVGAQLLQDGAIDSRMRATFGFV